MGLDSRTKGLGKKLERGKWRRQVEPLETKLQERGARDDNWPGT